MSDFCLDFEIVYEREPWHSGSSYFLIFTYGRGSNRINPLSRFILSTATILPRGGASYGPDAERLLAGIESILREYPLYQGVRVRSGGVLGVLARDKFACNLNLELKWRRADHIIPRTTERRAIRIAILILTAITLLSLLLDSELVRLLILCLLLRE